MERIDRSDREYTGTVSDMMTAKTRGGQHQLAKITVDSGKTMLVDLGNKDSFEASIKKGAKITVSGPAVKVNDRLMLVANEIQFDGETFEPQRVAMK
ncbi:MAG: hypothetical protein R3C05_22485 [Pirellulaceae bacterium]